MVVGVAVCAAAGVLVHTGTLVAVCPVKEPQPDRIMLKASRTLKKMVFWLIYSSSDFSSLVGLSNLLKRILSHQLSTQRLMDKPLF